MRTPLGSPVSSKCKGDMGQSTSLASIRRHVQRPWVQALDKLTLGKSNDWGLLFDVHDSFIN